MEDLTVGELVAVSGITHSVTRPDPWVPTTGDFGNSGTDVGPCPHECSLVELTQDALGGHIEMVT